MQLDEVRPYWEGLWRRRGWLPLKRLFDLVASILLLALLAVPMAVIALLIKREDAGPVLYRQERVTTYGRRFRIHKFRTMIVGADRNGAAVTAGNDPRVTGIGRRLRQTKLDELPQLLDVVRGDMSLVGTRPEVVGYVERYRPEYNATLLMPAGITSEASIRYKDEAELLDSAPDVDEAYMKEVLPEKMRWNLRGVREFSPAAEIATMFRTALSMLGRDYR